MLPFSLALVKLRMTGFKKFNSLISAFLWGYKVDRRPKIPLMAWNHLCFPRKLGGVGVWDLRIFQLALMANLVLSALDEPDHLWWPIFRDFFMSPIDDPQGLELLFVCGVPPSLPGAPISKFFLSIGLLLRDCWLWAPNAKVIPAMETLGTIYSSLTS
ncbi:hypothetical protein R1flu_011335 [Riccia fluitans]|uniref:Uncharacterized protein n=1 Tax=Riccia fluitans TaxID=41844 RepID=A0ABD1Z7Q4_9MARC